jgi:heat shock protein HslJ
LEGETLRLGATLGCNRMMGSVTLEGEAISFGPVAGTMMACPPPLDTAEGDLAAALAAVQSLRQDGPRLELLDASGAVLLGLTAADRP